MQRPPPLRSQGQAQTAVSDPDARGLLRWWGSLERSPCAALALGVWWWLNHQAKAASVEPASTLVAADAADAKQWDEDAHAEHLMQAREQLELSVVDEDIAFSDQHTAQMNIDDATEQMLQDAWTLLW